MSLSHPRPVAPRTTAHARAVAQPDASQPARRGPWPPLDVAADDPRLAPLAEALATRFARYCEDMPPEAFARLVRRAAWIRLRWPS